MIDTLTVFCKNNFKAPILHVTVFQFLILEGYLTLLGIKKI
jgi:hypothetical protein